MKINIKYLTIEQLVDLQSQIEKQLKVNKFPPKGTICECWDNENKKTLMYSNVEGGFTSYNNRSAIEYEYNNYRVVEQCLTFSDRKIK